MSNASTALSNDFDMEMEDFGKLFEESIKAGNQKEYLERIEDRNGEARAQPRKSTP
jgi:hypothetical protein